MSAYPDADDARELKAGSHYERAEAWRSLALDERRRAEQAEALLRYVLMQDMEHGDRGREPLDGLIERLGALMDAEVKP